MKIIIELTDQQAMIIARRYVDVQAHLQHCASTMMHSTMQERGFMPIDDVYTAQQVDSVLALPAAVSVLQLEQANAQKERDKQILAQKSEQEKTEAAKLNAEKEQAAQQQQQAADMQAQVEQRAKQMLAEVIAQLPKDVLATLQNPKHQGLRAL